MNPLFKNLKVGQKVKTNASGNEIIRSPGNNDKLEVEGKICYIGGDSFFIANNTHDGSAAPGFPEMFGYKYTWQVYLFNDHKDMYFKRIDTNLKQLNKICLSYEKEA